VERLLTLELVRAVAGADGGGERGRRCLRQP
jgi:hypothetical protein